MNPFARIYVEKIRKMIEEADVAFLLSDRIRKEALCFIISVDAALVLVLLLY